MIVNDFDLPDFTVSPNETDAPPVVDANTVLPVAVTLQGSQPISRFNSSYATLGILRQKNGNQALDQALGKEA